MGRTREPLDVTIGTELRLGWQEHRPYVGVAVLLFAVGLVVGAALVGRFDLFAWLGLGDFRDIVPGELTVAALWLNNARALLVMVLGVLTGGLLTAIGLVFNGVVLGYVGLPIAEQLGVGFVLVGVLPHGIVELPALFLGAAVAFRIVTNAVRRLAGRRDVVLGRAGWLRAGLLVAVALGLLAVAAVLEVHVTGRLLELLYGTPSP